MRVVLAKGSSNYGSLRLHIDQLASALIDLGHDAVVVDLIGANRADALTEAFSAPPNVFLTFSGVAHDVAAQDFMRDIGCAFVSLYVDHPIHHLVRLNDKIHKQALFFLDRSHVAFMSAWGAARAFAHIGFLPPGANRLDEPVDDSDAAFARRDIPLLFTGTYRGPPGRGWSDWPDSTAKQLVAETAERMAADGGLPLLDALRAALANRQAPLTQDILEAIAPLLPSAQYYAEAHHRHAVLTALGDAAIPIEVHGNGWEPLCARYPSFRLAGVGSFEETLGLLRRARIVLNINNGFVAGGHERVFSAMSAGACVVSESSAYYSERFKDGRDIATFSLDRLDRLPDQLRALIDDLPRQASIARAGYRRALAEHSWRARAAELIEGLGSLR